MKYFIILSFILYLTTSFAEAQTKPIENMERTVCLGIPFNVLSKAENNKKGSYSLENTVIIDPPVYGQLISQQGGALITMFLGKSTNTLVTVFNKGCSEKEKEIQLKKIADDRKLSPLSN